MVRFRVRELQWIVWAQSTLEDLLRRGYACSTLEVSNVTTFYIQNGTGGVSGVCFHIKEHSSQSILEKPERAQSWDKSHDWKHLTGVTKECWTSDNQQTSHKLVEMHCVRAFLAIMGQDVSSLLLEVDDWLLNQEDILRSVSSADGWTERPFGLPAMQALECTCIHDISAMSDIIWHISVKKA